MTDLFDWKPSAKIEPFPFHKCRPKVRHVAEIIIYHGGDWHSSGAVVLENGIRRHLERAGFGRVTIEREISAFRQAVADDINRLVFAPTASISPDGGDAA